VGPEYTIYLFVAVLAIVLFGLAALSARRPGKLDPVTGDLLMTYSLPLRVVGVGLGLTVHGPRVTSVQSGQGRGDGRAWRAR
jgi:hypothetical protein